MSKVTAKTIQYVADLARLNLTGEEKERLSSDLIDIIEYVDKLNELDTSGVEPTAHVAAIRNILRDDVVKKSYDRDEILANAPQEKDGCFEAPNVVE